MDIRHLAIATALWTSVLAPCFARECAKGDPAAAAVSFYEKHRDFIHQGAKSPPLSASLAKLVAANITQNLDGGDVGAIDWNFWADAQDGDVGATAKAISTREERGRVMVRLSYQFFFNPSDKPVPKESEVALTRGANGCWLVEDVLHNSRSVRKLLEIGTSKKRGKQ